MTSSRPATVVHLRLLPGLSPVAREPGVLQLGLDAPARALLPDHPDVRRLLTALAAGRPTRVGTALAASALATLERAGLVVEAAPPLPESVPPALSLPLLARHGPGATDRGAARAAARVLLDVPAHCHDDVLRLLGSAGVAVTDDAAAATVALVVGEREVARARTDAFLREGLPHLCVEAHDGGVTLGPLVVPGTTACLRCVDAHLGEHDPRRPIVLDQLARRPGQAPVERLTLSLATAWAVRDVVLFVEGERPATWSATVDLDTAGAPAAPAPRSWLRHPHCGCGWDSWPARLGAVQG